MSFVQCTTLDKIELFCIIEGIRQQCLMFAMSAAKLTQAGQTRNVAGLSINQTPNGETQ